MCTTAYVKSPVTLAAIECSERCVLHSQIAVTAQAFSCHSKIEMFLSCLALYLAARVTGSLHQKCAKQNKNCIFQTRKLHYFFFLFHTAAFFNVINF